MNGKKGRQTMNTLVLFYIGIPVLAIIAGLLSKMNIRQVTSSFNALMAAAVVVGAIYVIKTSSGWIHILSFIALTILGNLVGVFLVSRKQ